MVAFTCSPFHLKSVKHNVMISTNSIYSDQERNVQDNSNVHVIESEYGSLQCMI